MKKFIAKIKFWFVPCEENDYRPDFLDSDFLVYFIVLLIVLKLAILPFLAWFPKTNFFAEINKAILIELTNKQRASAGLPALKENPQLDESALLKAQDILTYDYFSHNSPQGKTPWYWIKGAGYNYTAAGENLGIGFLDSEEIYQAWNNSPSHRANLLNSKFQEIGIAVLTGEFDGNQTTIVVQHFGSPKIENKQAAPAAKEQKEQATGTPAQTAETAQTATAETNKTTEQIAGIESQQVSNGEKSGFLFKALKLFTVDYYGLMQKIELYSLFFLIISLAINIFVSIKIQHKDLIFKAVFFGLLLFVFILMNKELFIKIIPHNLGI